MPAKETKTAAELKVLIENELRKNHPECAHAEVIIKPQAGLSPWSASIYGESPAIDQNCRGRIDKIVAQMRKRFDLVPQNLDSHEQDRTAEKDHATAEIAAVIASIEAERRQPDPWERMCLVQAISQIFMGAYRLACSNAELARTPIAQRSPLSAAPGEPLLDRCDLALLRRALVEAEEEPVRRFPSFGPIAFRGVL